MRIANEQLLHQGHAYRFVDLTVDYADGATRHKPMVRHNGAATILPILETDGGPRIVMVRNERVTIDAFLLELPAGGLDEGEDPAAAAGRELIEETGYKAASLAPLYTFYTTPGLTDELMHVFVARDLTHVGQNLEPYESLTVELLPPDQAMAMIERGEMADGKTALTLLLARARAII